MGLAGGVACREVQVPGGPAGGRKRTEGWARRRARGTGSLQSLLAGARCTRRGSGWASVPAQRSEWSPMWRRRARPRPAGPGWRENLQMWFGASRIGRFFGQNQRIFW